MIGESSIQLLSPAEYRANVGSNVSTIIGSNITLVCDSEGVPKPQVKWKKDSLHLNVTATTYTVFASSLNASGNFSCVAENLGGYTVSTSTITVLGKCVHSSELSFTDLPYRLVCYRCLFQEFCTKLSVFFKEKVIPETATKPRIITSRESQETKDDRRIVEHIIGGNVTVLEGRDLLLRCPVEGTPIPSITWLFNRSPVQVSDTIQIDKVTGHLKVIEMTPEDVGEYTCVATNIAGEARELSYTAVIGEQQWYYPNETFVFCLL